MTTPVHFESLAAVSRLIHQRSLSVRQLVESQLDRVAALDAQLHAFVTVTADLALRAAERADREIAGGVYRGPLHGIPIAHKDLIQTAGVRTTAQSRLLQDWVPDASAAVVTLLERAGAISLGKTALHEFAMGSPAPDDLFPAARNPWNPSHMPGSSSSGSGAAVAAGMVYAAIGTDTGGSVRHPASVCGIVGLKPAFGRVSCRGVLPLAPSMDTIGPLTRTVEDAAVMLQAMAGHDPRDPHSMQVSPPDFGRLLGKPIKGMRIGVLRRFMESIEHTDEIQAAFNEAEGALKDLGAHLVDASPDGLEKAHEAATTVIVYEAYQIHRQVLTERVNVLGANFRGRFQRAPTITAEDYRAALRALRALRESLNSAFADGISVLINPAREKPAQTMDELFSDPFAKRSMGLRPFSASGHPAISLPMGFTSTGLPLGLQMAAAREDVLLQAARAYELAANWGDNHPSF
jgi:aspartyl-tRNA(Asn)/glutamyl-tRNA(Gln) amidotransferase subunit A